MSRWAITVGFILAYLAVMLAIGYGLWLMRTRVLAALDNPQARQEWQNWKLEEQRRVSEKTDPVVRRPPTSDEPPALILMRDHFTGILLSCFCLATFMFCFAAWIGWGTMHPSAARLDPAKRSLLDDGASRPL